jgi:hypothetical protein
VTLPPEQFLNLAPGLRFPAAEFVESKSAILGASGGGKSGALKVIEEELIRCRLPFVVFDPAGVAWGLRSSLDGKGPGLQILVVGGEHGDIPLNRNAGAEMAREVVRANCQVIFDLSNESTGTYQKFLAEFCEEFYVAQGESKTPRLVIIDEAHEILPQDVRRAESPAFAAARKLVTRGRNRGIGVCLVSQRPAGIAKSVLTQCGTLLIFGVLGTPDRKALQDWVSAWGDAARLEEFERGIASLRQQECWAWSPREFRVFKKVRIRDFRTLHPDYTHLRRMGLLDVKPVIADIPSLIDRLSKEVAKVKDEKVAVADVPRLRARIHTLEGELANEKARAHTADPGAAKVAVAEATKSLREQLAATEAERSELAWYRNSAETVLSVVQERVQAFATNAREHEQTRHPQPPSVATPATPVRHYVLEPLPRPPLLVPIPDVAPTATEDRPLGSGERRILCTLARRPHATMSRRKLAILTRYAWNGGGFTNYLGALRTRGYLTGSGENLQVTPAGVTAAGSLPPIPDTHAGLMAEWAQSLGKGERLILEAAESAYPAGLPREDIALRAGYTADGGGFNNYLGRLKTLGLLEKRLDGSFGLADFLYPDPDG